MSHAPSAEGLLWGSVGILSFSFTLPATRLALNDLSPVLIGLGRAALPGLLAPILLLVLRQPWPPREALPRLAILAGCILVGFPFLTSLALERFPVSHGVIVTALLPTATAVVALLRAGEHPSPRFWLASIGGLLAVLGFAAAQGSGLPRLEDLWLFGAVGAAALGYTEGGYLARRFGGWLVMLWALTVAAPAVVPLGILEMLRAPGSANPSSWVGYAYLSLVSVFLGLVAFYRGMESGGVSRIAQLHLAQPVLTLTWAAMFFDESIGPTTIVAALLVLISLAATQRARIDLAEGPRARSVVP